MTKEFVSPNEMFWDGTFVFNSPLFSLFLRAISVLLGDKWKKLGAEERRLYVLEAKMLADKQKQLHPDCWKRKRSMSTGVY